MPASSDTKKIASPGFAPVAAASSARLSSDRNFAIGPFACSASTRYATPASPSACPASTVLSKKLRDLSAAPGATIARTTLPAGNRLREHGEAGLAEDLRHVDRANRIAQIRLVGAERGHRLFVRDARKRRRRDLPVGKLRKQIRQHRLDRAEHVVLLDERHLEIELVELAGRPIGPRIFVAEARRDLKIAIEARHHQQLLELLRRLRQRVELARDECGWARDSRAPLRASSTSGSASDTRGIPARPSGAGCWRSPSNAARRSRESSRGGDRESGSAAAALRESPACRPPETAAFRRPTAPRADSATTSMRPVGSAGLMFSSVRAMTFPDDADDAFQP